MNAGIRAALAKLGPEGQLQLQVCDWLMMIAPWDRQSAPFQWCSIRNEWKGGAKEQCIQKRLGRRPGVADLMFWDPLPRPISEVIENRPREKPFFIELKAGRGGQSESQVEFERMQRNGSYAVCRSLEEVQEALRTAGYTWLEKSR